MKKEISFAGLNFNDLDHILAALAEDIAEFTGLSVDWHTLEKPQAAYDWEAVKDKQDFGFCTLTTGTKSVNLFRGDNDKQPWRSFDLVTLPTVTLSTECQDLLNLVSDMTHQIVSFQVSKELYDTLDNFVSLDTRVFVTKHQREDEFFVSVSCFRGLKKAHLMTVEQVTDILQGKLTTRQLHELGWSLI